MQKNKNRKRSISFTLLSAILLMTTILAACSSKNNDSNAQSPSATSSPSATATGSVPESSTPPEPATLRLLTDQSTAWPVKPEWKVWGWIKEATGIEIKQELQTGPESLPLAISSGDMPDLMSVFPADARKYGAQGAFIDLAQHLDKMPNVKKYLEERPHVAQRAISPDGKLYGIINDGGGAGNNVVYFYRDDIFAKHNLAVPTTWDELYTVSKELKKLYPDSYPFVFRHGIGTLRSFAPSFGIYPWFHEEPGTGKIKFGVADPDFKVLVEYLNKFYKEGLFPPDWLSMDYKAWTQFITTNKSFISIQFIGQIEIMNSQLKDGAHLKFMAPPRGTADKPYLSRANFEEYGFAVASTTKNLDAALRYLDFIYSEEGADLLSWGKEGESYTIVDGKRKFLPQFKTPNDLRAGLGLFTTGAVGLADMSASLSLSNENEQYSYAEAEKYQFPTMNITPTLTDEEKNSIVMIEEAVLKHYEASVAKFINGETPFTEWDAFLAELDKMGAPKLLETYQVALDRLKANVK